MQLNPTEMRLLQGAIPQNSLPTNFQIPAIHQDIPRAAILSKYETNFAELGRHLLKAGIINPEELPDKVTTPLQVVREGLSIWFNRRLEGLQHLRFDVDVFDAESANKMFDGYQWNGLAFDGPALAFTGSGADIRYVEKIARKVEKKVPGLFLAAFSELVSASYKTIEIQHPESILHNETSYSLWGTDLHSVTDEEALGELQDRFGDGEEADIEHYMPKAILEAYGVGFCFSAQIPGTPNQNPVFTDEKLTELSRSKDKQVSSISNALLALRQAARRVKKLKTMLKLPDDVHAQPLYVGCIILFNDDDRCSQYMDQGAQQLFETGEGTDLHSIDRLPNTAAKVKTYFQKLDALLHLIAQMDALIQLLSYPSEME